ncbi:MAG TPA: phosphodiester glycosidase family protein, partial [Acidimicrobiales bacterium]|nr:phosphodiester glycosidase family protein [Acidimicrobiales bacterium]
KVRSVLLVVLVLLTPVWVSLGTALSDPGLGSSVPARLAEWFRGHGGNWIVDKVENVWYSHHAPPVGGKPPKGAIPSQTTATTTPHVVSVAHLTPPDPVPPIASPAVPGEGQWHAAGRLVHGLPAVYETYMRPDTVHTSVVVGVAWMDTKLLSARLYSGSTIPGSGPWQYTAPVSSDAAGSLVAAFNSGFLMKNANGGYFSEGRTVAPLREGAASLVITRDGTATVAQWGRDATMAPSVVAVRQNLDLLVDNGHPVPGLAENDTAKWGYTLGNKVYVWRSGLGVTADGALVYVGGPGLNITDLADVLARAGAVRAMELDINTDWVNLATFDPTGGAGLATAANGADLLTNMSGGPIPTRYFASWWTRDFVTMSAR